MQVSAPQTASVVDITLEPGDELMESLKRAMTDAGLSEAFLVASGEIEDGEILTLSSPSGARAHRKVPGPSDLVTAAGTWSAAGLELRGTLSHDTELGASSVGGLLVRATVMSVHVRAIAGKSGSGVAPVVPPSPIAAPAAPPAPPPARAEGTPLVTPPPAPRDSAPALRDERPPAPTTTNTMGGPPLPPKLRRADSIEVYPEENDVVTHFAFGRCVVVFSDGERIRLQQDRDGRVREVALSMLRIEEPTILEDGRRHWELARKN